MFFGLYEVSCYIICLNHSVLKARRLFELICADEEFLPRAPEPDEIIFNDEGYNTEKNGSSSSEGGPEENQGEYAEQHDELPNDGEIEVKGRFYLHVWSAKRFVTG